MKQLMLITTLMLSAIVSGAQTSGKKSKEIVLLAGAIQPILLQGGNFEVDFYLPRIVFNYSHGFSLDMERKTGTTVGDAKKQSVAYHLPYSTGFGVGYRLNRYLDIRLEPKMHKFEAYYDGTRRQESVNQIVDYRTVTLGVGAYFRWKPFEKQTNALKGIFTSTSIRYWQNVWTSLDNNKHQYVNRVTNKTETLKAANIGIANTPFLFNIGIGYSIIF
ncbi:hypothetical protein ACFOET_02550 [Parapedobacter deserti]|uniref:Outer membrane protein beta-barrel domain-containing protein n=1 Tax=Parapedobacter deserti TaxID=1912957 RepID=A0ABV7JGU7_9SPHI